MIFKFWKNIMGFAFSPLYIKGKILRTVASVALPIVAPYAMPMIAPFAAAAIGGAAGGLLAGGGIKGAILGGVTAGIGAKFGGTLGGLGGATGAQQASSSLVMGAHGLGQTGRLAATGIMPSAFSAGTLQASKSIGTKAGFGMGVRYPSSVTANMPGQTSILDQTGIALAGRSEGIKKLATERTTQGGLTDSKILGFDKDKIGDIIDAGFSAYEGDIRQSQIDALQQNIGQYRSEFSDHYAKVAKENIAKLDRGELPTTYTAALEREKDRLTRLMIAQGHNPAEAGKGAEEVIRGTMDLEQKFIGQEKEFYASLAGGADTMTARLVALQQQQARELRPRETTLGELGSAVTRGIFGGNKPQDPGGDININLGDQPFGKIV